MRNGQRSCLMVIWMLLLCGTGFFVVLTMGSQRYGGMTGLSRRIRVEVQTQLNQFRPRPEFVPAPVAAPTVDASTFASQIQAVTPEALPVDSAQLSSQTTVATPTAAYQQALPAVELFGYTHSWQTWNNCGPATLATNLSFFKHNLDQSQIASILKPNPDDKNVNPIEMVAFAQSQGFQARTFVNGDYNRLKLLLSNNLPVLIETWLEESPNDGLGHYRLLVGYDDRVQEWIFSDSYVARGTAGEGADYRGIRVPYASMDGDWAVFNRTYLVIYPESMSGIVQGIIGPDMSRATMWQRSLNRFQAEIQVNPKDPFAWFNLGSTLSTMGLYDQAAVAFDQSRAIGLPWRMLWYQFEPFRAYYETGRYAELVELADATISAGGEIEEIYFWKGRALAAQNNLNAAKSAWEGALVINPSYIDASAALASIGVNQ
ncbi:MAG: C39 family peptidase [Chloroflexota bacterium]